MPMLLDSGKQTHSSWWQDGTMGHVSICLMTLSGRSFIRVSKLSGDVRHHSKLNLDTVTASWFKKALTVILLMCFWPRDHVSR